jgi:hypothetical protein
VRANLLIFGTTAHSAITCNAAVDPARRRRYVEAAGHGAGDVTPIMTNFGSPQNVFVSTIRKNAAATQFILLLRGSTAGANTLPYARYFAPADRKIWSVENFDAGHAA